MRNKILYFDSSATVPILPEVIEEIYIKMKETWGNPSSEHILGFQAKQDLDSSRKVVADYMKCDPDEIIFTGSASAANNLAIKGLCRSGKISSIVTNQAEHKSVLLSCENMLAEGCVKQLMYVDLDNLGHINLAQFNDILDFYYSKNPLRFSALVSVSLASSELGVIQDIKSISDIVHKCNSILHVDATQCFTKFPIDLTGIDLMTVGGSKIGAGKGIGVLYKKKEITLQPLIHGGKQEYGLIAGTEDIPKIWGFAKTLSIANHRSLVPYRNYFLEQLKNSGLDYIINGDMTKHLDNHICISFKDRKADAIVAGCSSLGLCISAGSACSSGEVEISPALKALHIPYSYVKGTVRITLPQNVSYEDIDLAIKILTMVVDNGKQDEV